MDRNVAIGAYLPAEMAGRSQNKVNGDGAELQPVGRCCRERARRERRGQPTAPHAATTGSLRRVPPLAAEHARQSRFTVKPPTYMSARGPDQAGSADLGTHPRCAPRRVPGETSIRPVEDGKTRHLAASTLRRIRVQTWSAHNGTMMTPPCGAFAIRTSGTGRPERSSTVLLTTASWTSCPLGTRMRRPSEGDWACPAAARARHPRVTSISSCCSLCSPLQCWPDRGCPAVVCSTLGNTIRELAVST